MLNMNLNLKRTFYTLFMVAFASINSINVANAQVVNDQIDDNPYSYDILAPLYKILEQPDNKYYSSSKMQRLVNLSRLSVEFVAASKTPKKAHEIFHEKFMRPMMLEHFKELWYLDHDEVGKEMLREFQILNNSNLFNIPTTPLMEKRLQIYYGLQNNQINNQQANIDWRQALLNYQGFIQTIKKECIETLKDNPREKEFFSKLDNNQRKLYITLFILKEVERIAYYQFPNGYPKLLATGIPDYYRLALRQEAIWYIHNSWANDVPKAQAIFNSYSFTKFL